MLQIHNLPKKDRIQALQEYEARKHNKGNAYLCRWVWFYRAYTKEYFLLLLFLISLWFGIGIIRWIIDLFMVWSYVNKKNAELDNELMLKYEV